MKVLLYTAFLIFVAISTSNGQVDMDHLRDSVVAEGKLLYKSEMASWYGTDVFLERFKDRTDQIGGYFSYSEKSATKCLFFSKEDNPTVLGVITFDSSYKIENALADGERRSFTTAERTIYEIRKQALSEINSDTLFKSYSNTNLNLIPLIENSQRKVYVLTGPQKEGVVIFGNDYLLTFNDKNRLLSKRQLHKNIIPVNYSKGQNDEVIETMHTHLPETGDFFTPTDICTLMLYSRFTNWERHTVISEDYVSIWDCKKNIDVALTKEAWDKIYKDVKKRKGN
jgi:hypothetical protein